MATVDLTSGGTTGHPSRRGKHVPYVVRKTFTGSDAATEKGSALAASDVIQALDIPADSVVTYVGLEVTTADTGSTLTFDVGDGTNGISGADATATGYTLAANDAVYASADTIDITIASLTSANDDWVADVFAVIMDVSAYPTVQSAKEAAS